MSIHEREYDEAALRAIYDKHVARLGEIDAGPGTEMEKAVAKNAETARFMAERRAFFK